MPDAYVPPAETRRYTRHPGRPDRQTIVVAVQQRPDVTGEGRLYVEVSIEAFEGILERAGFRRIDT